MRFKFADQIHWKHKLWQLNKLIKNIQLPKKKLDNSTAAIGLACYLEMTRARIFLVEQLLVLLVLEIRQGQGGSKLTTLCVLPHCLRNKKFHFHRVVIHELYFFILLFKTVLKSQFIGKPVRGLVGNLSTQLWIKRHVRTLYNFLLFNIIPQYWHICLPVLLGVYSVRIDDDDFYWPSEFKNF